ncbi:aldo/keto reductase [Ectobacillus ponti]|uniref:Aldo/keto reductase n=1 Tax=Ectobacillus ponti TaxID=2961894 RepID=A0AA42BPA8_9BACI|nr:aldo/keto reductase [Ectobacillus ponti]MCP8967359.1 aldo/keto reductase [Ectobacillus ponti]
MELQTKIKKRRLGSSDLYVSALGLGCWQFSKGSGLVGRFWPVLDENDVRDIVRKSLEGGINWFDTAEVYGKGKSEEALANALHALGNQADSALIATKWWPLFRTANSLTGTIEERLRALQGREIDLYQIHQPFSFSGVRAQMHAMAELLQSRKIRHAGVSNFNAAKMREAHAALGEHGFPLVSNQVKYSLLDRRIEENGILDAAKELGITIIAYSPLEQGILSGKFHQNPELIRNITGPRKYMPQFKSAGLEKTRPLIDLLARLADEYGVTSSQIALNWTIQFHGDTVLAIPGASKVRHAEENIGALQFELSPAHLRQIDEVSREVNAR